MLLRIHRFFLSQAFYPIVLSSLLALSIYIGRVLYSGSRVVYANLVWNLFLAWIPYIFSMISALLSRVLPRLWWLAFFPGVIWLAFFPNAPYLVTDFLHLTPRQGIPLWYDILLLASFSWTGVFLAIASLRTMQELVKAHLGWLVSWLFVAVALSLSGLGIYLGRFERWNSWDILFHPKSILADIAVRLINPFDNMRFFGFTILFTAFLTVCYLVFVSMSHPAVPSPVQEERTR
ncbi:MAG: DUF1361 domain-containing protein [Anaerolineales bacterium]|nr:DUF1361 domain-containing protein [Anaerolineales bacterium]